MHVLSRNLPVDAVLFNLDGTLIFTSTSIANTPYRALIDNETIRGRPDGQLAKLCPGVEASLEGLRQMGLKLGIVTNHGMCYVSTLLQQSGLSAWFDIVVDGDTLEACKPDTAPLLHACDALAVEPAHALYVGNSVHDAVAAQAAGMAMVRVNYGYRTDHPVPDLPCLQVIDDLSVLLELISGPRPWRRSKRSTRVVRQHDEEVGQWI
jgi:phosphoglycolate phosphatase